MLFAALVFLPVSGCAPSSPGIEPISDKDGAHPGRGWRISFRQVFLRMGAGWLTEQIARNGCRCELSGTGHVFRVGGRRW